MEGSRIETDQTRQGGKGNVSGRRYICPVVSILISMIFSYHHSYIAWLQDVYTRVVMIILQEGQGAHRTGTNSQYDRGGEATGVPLESKTCHQQGVQRKIQILAEVLSQRSVLHCECFKRLSDDICIFIINNITS